MAELTTLEEKPAEVTGLAGALGRMREEAGEDPYEE